MTGRVLMIQGTGSSAGKSLLVAALCRIFARSGVRVAPFKAQNMSNNAAVCEDGGEIGRSQALQATAAGIVPMVDMNPILLKPEAEARSQVIVNGRRWQTLAARDYFKTKQTLWPKVTAALDRLRRDFELVVIEGAGSPAELNLSNVEIVNMSIARYCQAPVLLVGDIERGGVFAQLLGTLALLNDNERSLVRGLLVNKFRGDVTLFDEGRAILEQRGGVPVVGVIPWIPDLNLPEEDSEVLSRTTASPGITGCLDIAVIRLPRISNFDDFSPLVAERSVRLRYVKTRSELGRPSVVILPGTKSTISDLNWLRESGLAQDIVNLYREGTEIVGICGGFQMLGQTVNDPEMMESNIRQCPGLELLPTVTQFARRKETCQARCTIVDDRHCPATRGFSLDGYEIHMGQTVGGRPWLEWSNRDDASSTVTGGAVSDDGRVWGCYLHGLFGNDSFRRSWLQAIGRRSSNGAAAFDSQKTFGSDRCFAADLDASLNRLADHVEAAIDREYLEQIVWNQSGVNA